MKKILYGLALILSIATAIGYYYGKEYEADQMMAMHHDDEVESFSILQKRARAGDVSAQYKLGQYFEGEKRDFLEAQKWYSYAATHGHHPPSQYRLAILFMNGQGVENNLPEAMKWFRRAAEQGEPRAQFFLGIASRDGWERKADLIEAYKWFWLAERQNDLVAQEDPRFNPKTSLEELDKVMRAFDRNEAIERARNWRPN